MSKMQVSILSTLLFLAACGASEDEAAPTAAEGEFDQTWPQSYATTTCADWNGQMSADQQRVAAADMLVGAQSRDGGEALPSNALIASFKGDITEACSADVNATIADVAVSLYLIGKEQYAP